MAPEQQGSPGFQPTRWSVVLAAAGRESSSEAGAALSQLCRTYWYPLYAYVRRQGHNPQDAEDLTQAFFARLLERRYLAGLQREGGRFRSFLLTALKRFLANEWDRARAEKRGGQVQHIAIPLASAETRYCQEPGHDLTPDRIYERQWAQSLLDRVMDQLQEEYVAQGRRALFEHLRASLSQPRGAIPYVQIAEQLNTTEAAIKMAVQRLRTRYRQMLRAEIAQTVSAPDEIDDEIRYLFSTFG